MKASFAKRLRTWLIILLAVGLFGAGVVAAVGVSRVLPNLPYFGTDSSSRNTQIVHAVTRTEQVSLMSLGIQGISSKNQKSTFQGIDIPGSERASFIQYSFSAKLGIEGKSVKIAQVAASEYLVSVPKFVFIGHSDVDFRLVIESSGVVSWVTPKIDTVEMVNAILNDDSKDQYIIENSDILKDQAKSFYGRIVSSIDPSISLKFEFG